MTGQPASRVGGAGGPPATIGTARTRTGHAGKRVAAAEPLVTEVAMAKNLAGAASGGAADRAAGPAGGTTGKMKKIIAETMGI